MKISCRALTKKDWPAILELFGDRGACGGCWCMSWRVPQGGKLWEKTKGAPAKRQFKKLVESGRAQGVLAFEGEKPVGWCALGPREDFPRIERVKAYAVEDKSGVWSAPCFYIHPEYRKQGLSRGLLKAAIGISKQKGAQSLEGYPIAYTMKDGSPLPAAFAWTGPLRIFKDCGFTPVPGSLPKKPLVRRRLGKN